MVPHYVSAVAYERQPEPETYTCAECVRAGAKYVQVFRTKSGIDAHLAKYHATKAARRS